MRIAQMISGTDINGAIRCCLMLCRELAARIEQRFGRLDLLVTNAGSGASVPPGHETPEEWRRVLDLNLFSAMNLIGAARPLIARGGGGAVVCISSICGREALGAPVAY